MGPIPETSVLASNYVHKQLVMHARAEVHKECS